MTTTPPFRPTSGTVRPSGSEPQLQYLRLHCSALLFQIGLAFVTFEQVRPLGIMLSDYCFLLSLLFFVPKSRLFRVTGSGILLGASLILAGALLSLREAGRFVDGGGSLARLFILFGLIAPLALCHSKDIYKSMFILVGGISVNCAVTLIQAWIFPGIVDVLSINPPQPDPAFAGRYQGLTEFPVTLGLSAALAVLLGIGLFFLSKRRLVRLGLSIVILICSVAALLSGSRTFLVSLVPAVIVFALFQRQRRRGLLFALAALVVLWGSVTYLAPGVVSVYSDRLGEVGLVDYGRLATSAQALMEISEKPILGWGVDHFDEGGVLELPETGEIAGAHDTFLKYWYAAGLLGAIGFLALFVIPTRRILQFLKERPADKSIDAVRLILACYVFFFIVFNLGPFLYNRYLYVPMFVFAGFVTRSLGPLTARKFARRPVVRFRTEKVNATSLSAAPRTLQS
jgi:O-Antigen ligase